jgi:hypothetical protein
VAVRAEQRVAEAVEDGSLGGRYVGRRDQGDPPGRVQVAFEQLVERLELTPAGGADERIVGVRRATGGRHPHRGRTSTSIRLIPATGRRGSVAT